MGDPQCGSATTLAGFESAAFAVIGPTQSKARTAGARIVFVIASSMSFATKAKLSHFQSLVPCSINRKPVSLMSVA
jgi:hypothetical protein